MSYSFDFVHSLINVLSPQITVDIQDLYDNIAQEQASVRGICFPAIASATGKETLGGGVAVGITIQLLGTWAVSFYAGSYTATIAGGNLVGGPGGDPVAYTAGVQVLLLQSAASTVVNLSGSVPTAAENANAVWGQALEGSYTSEQLIRGMVAVLMGKASGGPANPVFRDINDTTNRVSGTADSSGNRTAASYNL